MVSLYVGGIVIGILAALMYKKVMFKGEAVPFVMELPNYRIPSPKSVARLLWQKAKDFIQKAFSVILIASIIIWLLKSFDFHFNFVNNAEDSILAAVSGLIAPIFLLVFCLLYTPCVAAIAAIRRELGRKWAVGIVVWQCCLAWVFAYLVYLIGRLFIR